MFRRYARIWMIGVIGVVILYTADRAPIGSWAMLAAAPVLEALQAPVQWWRSFSLWFQQKQALLAKLQTLEEQSERQAALIQEVASLREENRQLRKLLDITNISGYRWHAAKVHGRSPETMSQRLLLEVKEASPDDVVVSSEGLVGVVESHSGAYASVRTILDASLAIPVTIPGSNLAALIRGQGDLLRVDFVPLKDAPKPGSILYTSGAGGLFPPGIAVAVITDVRAVAGRLFAEVEAAPVAHWGRDNWLAVASRAHPPAADIAAFPQQAVRR